MLHGQRETGSNFCNNKFSQVCNSSFAIASNSIEMAGKRARRTLSDLDDPSLFAAVDCLGGVTQLAKLTVLEVLNTPGLSDFCLFDL